MVTHLCYFMKVSLGEITPPDLSNFFTRAFGFRLLMMVPMPKGVKVPADLTPAPTQEMESARKELLVLIHLFTRLAADEPDRLTSNPLLGRIKLSQWAKLHGKHFDHHLRQFGV